MASVNRAVNIQLLMQLELLKKILEHGTSFENVVPQIKTLLESANKKPSMINQILTKFQVKLLEFLISEYATDRVDIICFFIEKVLPLVDKTCVDLFASTLLYLAVKKYNLPSNYSWVTQLVDNKHKLNITKNVMGIGHNALHEAVCQNKEKFVKYIMELDVFDVNCQSDSKLTCLMLACEKSFFEISRFLIQDKICDVNVHDQNGDCALHYAVRSLNLKIIELLIARDDCDINCLNNKGESPLQVACSMKTKPFPIIECFLSHSRCSYDNIKDITLPKRLQHYIQYHKAMKGTGSLEIKVVKCLLTGPPGSGKSTLKKRLLGQEVKEGETISTTFESAIPASSFRTVENQKAIVDRHSTSDDNFSWEAQSLDEEAVWIMKMAEQGTTNSPQKKSFNSSSIKTIVNRYFSNASSTASLTSDSTMPEELDVSRTSIPSLRTRSKNQRDDSKTKALKELRIMIQQISVKKQQEIQAKLIEQEKFDDFYIIDTGGQPEFQELLPAIITGPAINLLTFKLTDDLQEPYKITYRSAENGVSDPYESSLSHEEIILRSLVSIDCLRHSTIGWEFEENETPIEDGSKPAAILLATHKDKVSEEKVSLVNEKLRNKIETSREFYHKDLVQYRSEDTIIFSVDAINDKKEINELKSVVHMITNDRFQVLQVPVSWLVFNLKLRRKKQTTFLRSTCYTHARSVGIEDEKEFEAVLWFLHYRVGTILYYPGVEDLKDIIISNFQAVFSYLAKIIESFYNFRRTKSASTVNLFRSKGLVSGSNLKEHGSRDFTSKRFLSLLKHLNVIAGPIKISPRDDSNYYFLPCVLKPIKFPAELPVSIETTATPSSVAPLLISFECGYVPVGVFCSLVVFCLNQNKWELAQKDIQYRNKITFVTHEYNDFLCLINHCTYLELHLKGDFNQPTLHSRCRSIWSSLHQGLKCVVKSLHYTVKSNFFRGFPCSCSANSNYHFARLNKEETSAVCHLNNSEKIVLLDRHFVWLKKKSNSRNTASDSNDSSNSGLLNHTDLVEVKEMVKVSAWDELGLELGLFKNTLDDIASNHSGIERRRLEMLASWLKRKDNVLASEGPTMHQLVKALDKIGERSVADDIRKTCHLPNKTPKESTGGYSFALIETRASSITSSTSSLIGLSTASSITSSTPSSTALTTASLIPVSSTTSSTLVNIANAKRPRENTDDDTPHTKKQCLTNEGIIHTQNKFNANYQSFESMTFDQEMKMDVESLKVIIEGVLRDPNFIKFYTRLPETSRNKLLEAFAENFIITNAVKENPLSYDDLITEFASPFCLWDEVSPIHDHCILFLRSFVSVGGPCSHFAESLAKKWKECFNECISEDMAIEQ